MKKNEELLWKLEDNLFWKEVFQEFIILAKTELQDYEKQLSAGRKEAEIWRKKTKEDIEEYQKDIENCNKEIEYIAKRLKIKT